METNFSFTTIYYNKEFKNNFTKSNESDVTACDSAQWPERWEHIHEIFTCIGIVLVVLSCVGNIVAIVFIRKNPALHSPTYTGIACLAFCDIIAAIFRFLKFRSHSIYIVINGCTDRELFEDTISILSFLTLNSSYFHLTMISAVRYRLISRPFKTYIGLSCRTVLKYSAVCWGLSLIASIGYGAKVLTISHVKEHISDVIEIAFVLYLFSITIVPLLTIHILKIRKLRKSLVVNKRHEVRMHTMMAVISVSTVACILPIAGLQINKTIKDQNKAFSRLEMFVHGQLSQVFLALNHALHPLLFFLLSELTKKKFKPFSQNDVINKCLVLSEESLRSGNFIHNVLHCKLFVSFLSILHQL
ncbi:melanocyte-stimulating hormone receptor-like [Saccostrea echinata]|uniref:melanocyte-stimulating hormone receptor-like n=1 Tax=Saccostrea echinata TaxID=191078 RepID=UPI002A830B31|nr:melanocyte-stimulating hormone receptor-like [Saccostrea echinata]